MESPWCNIWLKTQQGEYSYHIHCMKKETELWENNQLCSGSYHAGIIVPLFLQKGLVTYSRSQPLAFKMRCAGIGTSESNIIKLLWPSHSFTQTPINSRKWSWLRLSEPPLALLFLKEPLWKMSAGLLVHRRGTEGKRAQEWREENIENSRK